ncbi:hypothetical protein F5880DRAFT_1617426 [Lentinula raphanica]|nr:hypothetical protein F5880DRAFT_1617426 [Lentinula raphanica]
MRLSTTFNKSLSLSVSFSAVVILSVISSQLHLVSAAPAPVVPVPAPTPAPAPFPEQVQAIRTTAPQAQDQAGGVTGVAAGFSLVERDNHDGDDDVAGFGLNPRDIRYDVDGVGGRGGVGGNTVGLGGGGGSFGQPKPSPQNLQAGSPTSQSASASASAIEIRANFQGTGRKTSLEEQELINSNIQAKLSRTYVLYNSLHTKVASQDKRSITILGTCNRLDSVDLKHNAPGAGGKAPKIVSYAVDLGNLFPGGKVSKGVLNLVTGKHVIKGANGRDIEVALEKAKKAKEAAKKAADKDKNTSQTR